MGMSDFRSLASAPLSSHTTARSWRVGASLISQTKAGRRFASQPVRISRRYEQVATSWWILNQTVRECVGCPRTPDEEVGSTVPRLRYFQP